MPTGGEETEALAKAGLMDALRMIPYNVSSG